MSDGGHEAVVLNDRGRLLDLRLDRGPDGRIAAVSVSRVRKVPRPDAKGAGRDTEGLAVAADGQIFISFEGRALVAEYLGPDTPPRPLPIPPAFERLAGNRGLEGLAIAPNGTLWTLAEERIDGTFPLHTWQDGAWQDGPTLPSDGIAFVPVGLDFDDRGRLYVLERQFMGPFGFRSRLRRFTVDGTIVTQAETLMQSDAGAHDNLEGVAVWRNDSGQLIATMVSDDNFFPFQRTEFVEYALPD